MKYEVTAKYISNNSVIVEANDMAEAILKVQEQELQMTESYSEVKWTAILEPNL